MSCWTRKVNVTGMLRSWTQLSCGRGRHISSSSKSQIPCIGICLDIDGVLARGSTPLPEAIETFRYLQNLQDRIRLPVVFVTNALNRDIDKAAQLSHWFGIKVLAEQMVQAQAPLSLFKQYHHQHCLFLGQGKLKEIAKDVGFSNVSTIEDVVDAFPHLDVVDHSTRHISPDESKINSFQPIDAIISLTEPNRWDTVLQLTCDLLLTHGDLSSSTFNQRSSQLPVLAANMDLQFMHKAHIPRFGHGSFLLCLEALYKKLTGNELKYSAVMGKPSEMTFRIAENRLHIVAKLMGIEQPVTKMYMIGDNEQVDILGANLYQNHIRRMKQCRLQTDLALPQFRRMPPGDANMLPQTIEEVNSILVCTGVYQPMKAQGEIQTGKDGMKRLVHSHRDFELSQDLLRPSTIVNNILDALHYITEKELIDS